MPTTKPPNCDVCHRLIDVTTTRISIQTTLDQPVLAFDCRQCGHTNQRPIDGARLDFLVDVLGFPIDGQDQPEIRFGR